ncbi:Bestrophin, RFP-TM, chloride channel-domain-containing protein [Cyathus striatus]|nr:Bestrophin, RFP-TM, chloride channel-domain-containing protein [Cyathus striatus]
MLAHTPFLLGWSTLITVLNHNGHNVSFQPTLLTVIGTVLGFVISYRTTSSFERYNEGRRLWSQIIFATRTFARVVWLHVPDPKGTDAKSTEDSKARALIEKKTVINLLEAFAVAVKHYLRGEDGIYYKDLYYLVKFLPAYALPHGMPTIDVPPEEVNIQDPKSSSKEGYRVSVEAPGPSLDEQVSTLYHRNPLATSGLPSPVTSPSTRTKTTFLEPVAHQSKKTYLSQPSQFLHSHLQRPGGAQRGIKNRERMILSREEEAELLPAYDAPKYGIFDLFPFSLLVNMLTERGRDLGGKKAAKTRAKMLKRAISHNLPLELSLYLSSYVSALEHKQIADASTINALLAALSQLVDSLTGLERILTTPIPFSYSIHLWLVTIIYCISLPFQIWATLQWLTIPATIIASFIFFGFLVAGEEIESMSCSFLFATFRPQILILPYMLDPFGYDKNDLNLDHFTNNIIRNELQALTSMPPPDPAHWAFSPENNLLFSGHIDDRVSPDEWLKMGYRHIQDTLSTMP